jgi:ABC-type branched-subunit amino acid transport system substrate-binding protein/predicted negative regulator of RcsB-dependent stress response
MIHFFSPYRIVFLTSLLAFGCASTPKPLPSLPDVSDDPVAEAEFRQARAAFEAGRLDDAKSAFESFVAARADDPLAGPASLLLARIELAQNRPQEARAILAELQKRNDATAQRALLYDAVALHALGQSAEALETLVPLTGRLTDPDEANLHIESLVGAASDLNQPAKALVPLSLLLGYSPSEPLAGRLRELVDTCLLSVSTAKELESVLLELEDKSPILEAVTVRYARLSIEERALDNAQKALERAVSAKLGRRAEIVRLLDELAASSQMDTRTVGCILPMSGRSKLVGEHARRGVMLGAERVQLGPEGDRLSVILRDDAGDPARAQEAVRNLVEQENVAAIIGPLDAASASAAAEEAERLGVPLLALSSRESRGPTTTLLRPFTSHRAEVRALLDRAVEAAARRVVLLVPDSDYGKLVAGLAREESQALGISGPQIVHYSKDANSFGAEAKQVAGLKPEALLLADSAGKIALLAPALAAAGVWSSLDASSGRSNAVSVLLLVTSPGWSSDLLRRAGRYLQGALFVTYFEPWISSSAQSFVALYNDEYAAVPNFIAALGHDAALLVGAALKAAPKSRGALREWLISSGPLEARSLPLATSFGGFDRGTGEPLATPWLLRVEGSEAVVAP